MASVQGIQQRLQQGARAGQAIPVSGLSQLGAWAVDPYNAGRLVKQPDPYNADAGRLVKQPQGYGGYGENYRVAFPAGSGGVSYPKSACEDGKLKGLDALRYRNAKWLRTTRREA